MPLSYTGGNGLPTTFYVCCSPPQPNTFSFSPPAEAAFLGWYAAAKGYNGFLRWAYDSWTENPLYDTRFIKWPAGDCFLVYPGGRSSIRFERLREGIQDYEKLRIVRTRLEQMHSAEANNLKNQLDKTLAHFSSEIVNARNPYADTVQNGKKVLLEASRFLAKQKT